DWAQCQLTDTDLPTLHTYLTDSHHTPVCVLVRNKVSSLERRLMKLQTDDRLPLTAWRLTAVNTSQGPDLPQYLLQHSTTRRAPLLRCFLGELVSFDFEQPQQSTVKSLRQWFMHLVKKQQQMSDAGVEMIRASAGSHQFTLVVFPTVHQHTELENAAFKAAHAVAKETSVEVIIVHPSSPNFRQVTEEFHISSVPAVLLFKKGSKSGEEYRIFSVHELLTDQLETHLRAELVPSTHLTDDNFKSEVMEVKKSELYKPYLVGFYAWWEIGTSTFLSFLRLAAQELAEMEANVRFGLIDVGTNPAVMSQYMSAECLKKLPFIALFQRVQGTTSVKHSELLLKRPSTFAVYTALQQEGLVLRDRERHICMEWEGPQGYACSAAANTTQVELHWASDLDKVLVQKESTRLIATLMPRDSRYLPLPPGKNKAYFYGEACLQLLCEHLFGLAQCYTVYSTDIPGSEFYSKELPMVVMKIVFERRDGVSVTIMELGKSLMGLLEAETSDTLHMFHQPHSYNLQPNQKCEEDHARCSRFLEEFTRDHTRLPVTHLTSEIFHTRNNPVFKKNLPVLLALAEPDNLTTDAPFVQLLSEVAVAMYKEVVVAALDVSMFRAWAGTFVPQNYGRHQAERSSWGQLGVYPRFCMLYWEDHTQAAFYPPVREHGSPSVDSSLSSPSSENSFTAEAVLEFVHNFLKEPSKHLIPTERF
ncbi:hypothetical protein BaRGS_00020298, partial [Batillaria attramentaria]